MRSLKVEPAIAIASIIDASMCSPMPVRRARSTAANAGARRIDPADELARPPAGLHRRTCGTPPIGQGPRFRLHGELGRDPAGEGPGLAERRDRQHHELGMLARSASMSRPAGPESSTTRSAPATSSSTSASPGRPITERLPALRYRKSTPAPSPVAPSRRSTPAAVYQRSGSPPGGSTFTTSAPASTNSFVQYGPAIPVLSSTTRMVESAFIGSRGRRSRHDPTGVSCGWYTPLVDAGCGRGGGCGRGEDVMSPGSRAAREPRTRAVRPIGSGTTPRARARAGRRPSGPSGTRR